MILGLGIDLVNVDRIQRICDRYGQRFQDRILTDSESLYCGSQARPAISIAGRFAAKEAVSKAFGTGLGAAMGWRDIEIQHSTSGAPEVILHGPAHELSVKRGIQRIHLSITHTESQAMAVAILEN